jgi:hypothetical protein
VPEIWYVLAMTTVRVQLADQPDSTAKAAAGDALYDCRRGCRRAVVEISSFQAPAFYLRHGYQEFGRVAFILSGAAGVFLSKEFTGSPTAN